MKLQLPFREFDADSDAHESNIRAIERYLNEPQAGVMLEDHAELPDPERWPVGSLVRSQGGYYQRKEDGWEALVPANGQNDAILQWSFSGDLLYENSSNLIEDWHPLNVPFDCIVEKIKVAWVSVGGFFWTNTVTNPRLIWGLIDWTANNAPGWSYEMEVFPEINSGGLLSRKVVRPMFRLSADRDYVPVYLLDADSGTVPTTAPTQRVTVSIHVRRL